MSLPEVRVIRERIESIPVEKYKMFLKACYLLGARAVELTGKRCSGEKNQVYGPKGSDAWIAFTEPPDIPPKDLANILITALSSPEEAKNQIKKLTTAVQVGIFKIKIGKQKLEEGEEAPYRLIALPFDYEPWARDLYHYFKEHENEYVFPFNRSEVWDYVTHTYPVFKGLTYRIKKYNYLKSGQAVFKVLPHPRKAKIHFLRHIRADELISKYNFDSLDMVAFVGWKLGKGGAAAPAMADVYAEIREAWTRYIKKLCKVVT